MLKSKLWVSLLHLCMSKTHSVWKLHSACLNHSLHMKSRSACINHTRTCRNHTHMWQNHTLRVKITLVRVETTVVWVLSSHSCMSETHYVWKLHSACRYHTLRIALCWYKSHSWVSYSHAYVPKVLSCVWKPHSACKNRTLRVEISRMRDEIALVRIIITFVPV
jgi:hypothetical protein